MKKKHIFALVVAALGLFSLAANTSITMVGSQDHPEDFHFFHAIHLDDEAILTKDNMIIQPLMLSKDHDYDFVLKGVKSHVTVVIKDDRGELVATNYDSKTNTYYNSIVFQSHITEFYHIEIKAEEYQDGGQCVVYSKCHLNEKQQCKN